MQHSLTFKHVDVKPYLTVLVDELLERLEGQTTKFHDGSVFTHVVIEQNKARTLFRVSLRCTVPKHELVVHEEGHDAVATVREAFEELEQQLNKFKEKLRRNHLRKKDIRRKAAQTEISEEKG